MSKLSGCLLLLALVCSNVASSDELNTRLTDIVDKKGNIGFPEDFEKNMSLLGSWFVPEGEASGFHQVFTSQASIDSYNETGIFPDGTVIVKELRDSKKGNYTTGANISYPTSDIKQWFVMVKDSKNSFPKNQNWGEGWGWALFKTDSKNNVSTNYRKDCLGCHIPAKENDWLYTEAYPVLNVNN